MAHVVRAGTGVRHRLIFELRYDRGELYWDRCGGIARTLAAKKGWAWQSIDVNGAHIWNEDQNLIFTYSPTKLDLAQSLSQDVLELLLPGQFAAIAEEFSEAVIQAFAPCLARTRSRTPRHGSATCRFFARAGRWPILASFRMCRMPW